MKYLAVFMGTMVALAISAGCGNTSNTTVKGEVGLTRGTNNHVTALVMTCGSSVTLLDVAGSREGLKDDQVNPELGEYHASEQASGTIRLDLEAGNPGWKTTKQLDVPAVPTNSVIVTGFHRESDSQTTPTTATRDQLHSLKPGHVLRSDGSTVPEARFLSEACSR